MGIGVPVGGGRVSVGRDWGAGVRCCMVVAGGRAVGSGGGVIVGIGGIVAVASDGDGEGGDVGDADGSAGAAVGWGTHGTS